MTVRKRTRKISIRFVRFFLGHDYYSDFYLPKKKKKFWQSIFGQRNRHHHHQMYHDHKIFFSKVYTRIFSSKMSAFDFFFSFGFRNSITVLIGKKWESIFFGGGEMVPEFYSQIRIKFGKNQNTSNTHTQWKCEWVEYIYVKHAYNMSTKEKKWLLEYTDDVWSHSLSLSLIHFIRHTHSRHIPRFQSLNNNHHVLRWNKKSNWEGERVWTNQKKND